MKIKFDETGYELTTEHPLSSYGLGILVGPGGSYMPSDALPTSKEAYKFFQDDMPPMLAGEFVVAWASKKIMSDAEIDLIRRYLSQDVRGVSFEDDRFKLPPPKILRKNQCEYQLYIIMGDISQGVHQCYWDLGKARVSTMLYEATNGKFVWEHGEIIEAEQYGELA